MPQNPFSSPLEDLRVDSSGEADLTRLLYTRVKLTERGRDSGIPPVEGLVNDKFWVAEDETFFGFMPDETYTIPGYRADLWLLKAKTQGQTDFNGYPDVMLYFIPEGTEIHRDSPLSDFEPRARCCVQPV